MTIRMSAGARRLNLIPRTTPQGGIYHLIELFTTHNGSWEPSSGAYGIEQWARDKYLRSPSAPDYFDDAGGDHHLFARVVDENGAPLAVNVLFWSKEISGKPIDPVIRSTGDKKSLWANIPIWDSYDPAFKERGDWRWGPVGAAEAVDGGGLPLNHHVSVFAVWQRRAATQPIEPTEPTPPIEPTDPTTPDPVTQEIYVTEDRTLLRIHGRRTFRIEVLYG